MKKIIFCLILLFVLGGTNSSLSTLASGAKSANSGIIINTNSANMTSAKSANSGIIINTNSANMTSAYSNSISAYDGADIMNYLEEFVKASPNRKAGSDEQLIVNGINYGCELISANYLVEKFVSLHLDPTIYESEKTDIIFAKTTVSYLHEFSFASQGENFKSQNVIGIKKSNAFNPKNVIISAHYDNAFDYAKIPIDGTSDNASGVAIMLAIAENLRDIELPFDLTFIAFGAEQAGLLGSRHFLASLSKEERENIILSINIDSVGFGDNVYFYTDELKTGYDNFIRKTISESNLQVKSTPTTKKIIYAKGGKFPYLHSGLMSDNLSFINSGTKSVLFFSGNLDTLSVWYTESRHNQDIMQTSNDNFENAILLYPNAESHMQQVAILVQNMLTNENFESIILGAKKANYDIFLSYPLTIVLAFLCLLCFGLIASKYYKSIPDYISEVKSEKECIFEGFE